MKYGALHNTDTRSAMIHGHCVRHILSLIAYAQEHIEFRDILRSELDRIVPSEPSVASRYPILSLSRWLLPRDLTHAYERMQWVLSEVVRDPVETRTARALLAEWQHEYAEPEPKNIVIGLVGLAIPGPTLGIIKRTRNDAMRIVIRDDVYARQASKVASTTHAVSIGLLADQLRQVHGHAYRLDPDMAHWFFGDRALSIFHAPARTLDDLVFESREEGLPAHVQADGDGIEAVSLSPMVGAGFLAGRNITPLP